MHQKQKMANDFCSLRNTKKISLSDLQKHMLVTSPYSDLKDYFWRVDDWIEIEPRVCDLHILHSDFRGNPTPVGTPYIDFVESIRNKIDDEEGFPFAKEIKAGKNKIKDFPQIILIYRSGNIVVTDGTQRTICACYHRVQTLKAYIFGVGK